MMQRSLLLFLLLTALSCKQPYTAERVRTATYRISADTLSQIDSGVYRLILPYKNQLDRQMSETVVVSADEFKKELPSGTLNNMFCDVLLGYAQKKVASAPMVCVMNYGGIRLPFFPKGNISMGKVYELMPFDNELVLAEVNGEMMNQLAKKIAEKGGEPVAGMSLTLDKTKVSTLLVDGEQVIASKVYYVLLSDYMANGGDGYGFIKEGGSKIVPLGIKVRDALIAEFRAMLSKGEMLKAVSDERIRKN